MSETLNQMYSILYREAVEAERDVLALLAKLEPSQLTVASKLLGGAGGRGGQIELVVSDGVEVLLPMAGDDRAIGLGLSVSGVPEPTVQVSQTCRSAACSHTTWHICWHRRRYCAHCQVLTWACECLRL